MTIEKLGTRSVTYATEFFRDGQSIAQGSVTAVCCRVTPDRRLASIEIPAAFREKLQRFMEGNKRACVIRARSSVEFVTRLSCASSVTIVTS